MDTFHCNAKGVASQNNAFLVHRVGV